VCKRWRLFEFLCGRLSPVNYVVHGVQPCLLFSFGSSSLSRSVRLCKRRSLFMDLQTDFLIKSKRFYSFLLLAILSSLSEQWRLVWKRRKGRPFLSKFNFCIAKCSVPVRVARGLRRRSAVARLLRLWFGIPPRAWMFVCCECCVLSARGFCDELITRPEESYRLRSVVLCGLWNSWMRRL